MQSAPAGWPTSNDELTPTATIVHTVNGSEETAAPVAWSVRRELATDLPEQVQSVEGLSVASASVDIAQDEAETVANRWSPWQGRRVVRHPAGAQVRLTAGFGGAEIAAFVGRVAEPSGDVTQPTIRLDCDDLASLLRHPAMLPAVAREMPHADGGAAVTLHTGLTAVWVVDTLLRQAGFAATPAQVDGAVLSLPLQGALWPEVGTLTAADQGDSTQPVFAGITWDSRRALGWQTPAAATFTATVRAEPGQPLGDMHVSGWCDGTSGTATIDLRAGGDAGDSRVTITVTASQVTVRVRADGGAVDTSAVFTFAGGPFDVDIERLASSTVRVTFVDSAGTDTDDLTTGGFGGNLVDADISLASGDLVLAGVQVSPQQSGTVAVAHEPTADLDRSLNPLDGTPGLQSDVTQWEVLREVAGAELAALFIDEAGVATFRNRDSLRGVGGTPLPVTARDSILGVHWWSSVNQLRSEVRVPVMPVVVNTSTDVSQTVWQLDEKIPVPPFGVRPVTILAELDAVPVQLDTVVSQSESGTTGSVYAAHQFSDGGGSLRTLTIAVDQLQPRLVRITVRSQPEHVNTTWIVDSNGDPRLILRALAAIAQGTTPETFAVAENPNVGETFGQATLTLPASRWRQDLEAAQGLAWWLAEQTRLPQPIIRSVPVVPGPDTLRLQLGDLIELVDPVVMDATIRCVVTGIDLSGAPGRLEQTLSVRPLPYLFADFAIEWDGETFNDFNTEQAGQTFGDYNDDPWRVS